MNSYAALPTLVHKSWGCEKIYYNGSYCSKALIINPGGFTSNHYHPVKHETMIVTSGEALIEFNYKGNITQHFLQELDSVIIPPNTPHKIYNNSAANKLIIIESSTPDNPQDSVRINNVK